MFTLLFSYNSWTPPSFEVLKKRIEVGLKPLCGNVGLRELPHYSLSPATWVMPIEVSTQTTPTVEEISRALEDIDGARLFEVKMDESEPSVGGSADLPVGLPAVGVPVTQPPGSERGDK